MIKKHLTGSACFLIMLLFFGKTVSAGGFENGSTMGMKAASMGGTFTAIGSDASSSFYNPGAMSFLEFSQLSLGASFRIGSSSYLSPFSGNSDMDQKMTSHIHLYGVGKLNDQTAVGISVNTPFCLRTSWKDDWTGRYIIQDSRISATYIQPTVSYLFGESFSVGIGPVLALGKTVQTKAIPYNSSSGEVGAELDGNSTGIGANLGLIFKPNEDFSLGLSYRSSVKMKVKEGDVSFSNVPSSLVDDYPSSLYFSTEYTLPSVISLGAAFNLTRDLLISMDVNYTTWKSFDSLEYSFSNHPELNYGSGKYYENTFAIRLGGQYQLSEKLQLRGGIAFDQSPV
ncbi:MAG TPA: outer membrane protein transport protein, partial [Bacteroidia bacterium]|nr:outer membrane protein transport protein [Bacteroidia bacterium]